MTSATSSNPLAVGLAETLAPQACTLVIFGASGDLARRKLLPALYNLFLDGLLPAHFAVLGFSRTPLDDAAFRKQAREGVRKFSRRPLDPGRWGDFEPLLHYLSGAPDDPAAYEALRHRLSEIEKANAIPPSHVFYLSVPPSVITAAVEQLKAAGLAAPPDPPTPFSRIIVEKPIGHDLESAERINETLSHAFDERQVFRIDHYLGKETVQNILVMRFANWIFEPLWNQKHVDHVQITVAEEEGVGTRARYYEEAGALRDMVQNHMLQLLSLTAMEPPWSMDADVVRNHRLAVLNCLRPITAGDIDCCAVRAQYGRGFQRGREVPGYREEDGVAPDSKTETYVALKAHVDNWRWAGVPFYIRTGRRLPKRATEIAVQFKKVPPILFNANREAPLEPNVLVFRIQPDEGLSLRISSKLPGTRVRIYPVKMDFRYGSTFGEQSPEAYERLLLDVMAGDPTLFMRRDSVESSWRWVTGILRAWESTNGRPLPEYRAGTWGPEAADRLIAADGRSWRTL